MASIQDGGDQEAGGVPLGGVRQGVLARERLAAGIVAEDVPDIDPVGQRLDPLGVDLLEVRHVVHDRV